VAELIAIGKNGKAAPQVLDGDTLIIAGERVRLRNVYAAESNEPGGPEAKARLQALVASGNITIQRSGYDPHGRTLATVYIGSTLITQDQVGPRAGRGAAYDELPPAAVLRAGPPLSQTTPAEAIVIPAWDDVIKLTPRPKPTTRERAVWRNIWNGINASATGPQQRIAMLERIKAGDLVIRDLTPDVQRDLAGRYMLAEQMRVSEIPGWRQEMVKVLTWLDNLQDDVATAARIARPILSRVPGGPFLTRVLKGTADVLNDLEKVVAGPTIYGLRQKKRAKDARKPNIKTRKGVMGGVQKVFDWVARNSAGLIEGAQSSANHLGVGLQLGAIFGALEEAQDRAIASAWHAGKWAVALYAELANPADVDMVDIMRRQQNDAINRIRETGAPLVDQLGRAAVAAAKFNMTGALIERAGAEVERVRAYFPSNPFGRLADTARAAAGISADNPLFSAGDHALALYQWPQVAATLTPALAIAGELAPLEHLDQLDMPHTQVTSSITREILSDFGISCDARGFATHDAAALEENAIHAYAAGIDAWTRNNNAWLKADPETDAEHFMHALAEAALPEAAQLLTGSRDGIRDVWEPELRAAMMLYHLGTYPPRHISRAALAAWLRDQVNTIEMSPDDYDERTAARLTRAHWPIAPTIPT